MKFKILIFILSLTWSNIYAQTLSPVSVPAAGGTFVSGGVHLSWTAGQPASSTLQNGNIVLTQGQQQPYIILHLLNIRAFIEGYYLGGGMMSAALYNTYPMDFQPDECDSITVALHQSSPPYSAIAVANAIILTNGNASAAFPSSTPSGNYYIVLRHWNTVETWSKLPVLFNGAAVFYDFSLTN